MVIRRRSCALLIGLILTGCQPSLPQLTARLENEGAVYLYLQPLPREAERLRMSIEAVAAVPRDGSERPIPVLLRELAGEDARRQRLLAAGALPAGDYTGFAIRTGRASLRGEAGRSPAPAPEAVAKVDFPFTVRRRDGQVVLLTLDPAESRSGDRLDPVFSAAAPRRPAVGHVAFVANSRSSDVTVFDKKSLDVFDVVVTGRQPAGMALDRRARKLYVALAGDAGVDVVDVFAGQVTERFTLTPGDEPAALALTPDGRTLLSANRGSNTVSILDTASGFEVARLPVGNGPRFVVIDPTGRGAFVFNSLSNTVSVIDIAGRTAVRTIATDPAPVQGAFSRRGDRLWVVHERTAFVTVINPTTLAVTGRFAIRSAMDTLAVDPGTDVVYVGGRREFAVGVYDPLSFAAVDFIDTGAGVAHIAVDSEENALYFVSPGANRVLVSHRVRKGVVGAIDVGDGPAWVSLMGER
ncbi:MAG: beta-propeller fold lactonase family protein [Candidatus Rokubacteria bacterium]|nr:beta-propeller fold lactonase family protein [Candidatus Rokubacteria bacterium]